jgi:hypothetical protein
VIKAEALASIVKKSTALIKSPVDRRDLNSVLSNWTANSTRFLTLPPSSVLLFIVVIIYSIASASTRGANEPFNRFRNSSESISPCSRTPQVWIWWEEGIRVPWELAINSVDIFKRLFEFDKWAKDPVAEDIENKVVRSS